jgi:hypothetical protein
MEGIIPGAHVNLFPCKSSQECKPPNEVPLYCCLGSYPARGGMNFIPNSPCANQMVDDYGWAKQVATQFLKQHPVEGNECDTCQIVNILINYNLTVAFHGNSLSDHPSPNRSVAILYLISKWTSHGRHALLPADTQLCQAQ